MKLIIIGIVVGLVLAISCFFIGMYVGNKSNEEVNINRNEHYMLAKKIDIAEERLGIKIDNISQDIKELLKYARGYVYNPDLTIVK